MAFTTPVVTVTASLGASGGTTSGVDTTGASLLVVAVGYYQGASGLAVSDSKGNTWNALTPSAVTDSFCKLFYAQNPTVGSGHTFTVSGTTVYASISVQAWAGADTASVFDQQNNHGDAGGVTSVQPGSVTPGSNGQLLVTAMSDLGDSASSGRSINSSFTITGQQGEVAATSYGIAMAYFVQTTAAAINPTWSWSVGAPANAVIASFKPSSGGGGGTRPVKMAGPCGGFAGDNGGFAG